MLYRSCIFSYDLDVKARVHVDMSIREHVKRLVLLRRDMYEGDVDPTEEPPSKTSSVKHLFCYLNEGTKRATMDLQD